MYYCYVDLLQTFNVFNFNINLNWFQVAGTPQDKKSVSNGNGKNEDPDLVINQLSVSGHWM